MKNPPLNNGDNEDRAKVNRGLAWVGASSTIVWILDIVSIFVLLNVWLPPEEMGVAVLAITLFPVLDLIADLGVTAAVVQRDDHDQEVLSTLFWINLSISIVIFLVIWFALGPLLVSIHNKPLVAQLLGAYGLKLMWHNIYLVPGALMKGELRFKELSAIRTVANFADFVGKFTFAILGFGVWCLILGPFLRVLVQTIGIQWCRPWRPAFVFRYDKTKEWLIYGIKTSASRIVYHLYTSVDYQLVSFYFGDKATGLYWCAYEIILSSCHQIAHQLQFVAFPVFSRIRSDATKLAHQFLSLTRISLIVMIGFLCITFISAEELMFLIWKEKGLQAVPAARILCGVGLLRSMSFIMTSLLDAVGRPGLNLLYNSVAALVMPILFILSAETLGDALGYQSVAWAWVLGYPIAFAVLVKLTLNQIPTTGRQYLKTTTGIVFVSICGLAVGFIANRLSQAMPDPLQIACSTLVFLIAYYALLRWILKIDIIASLTQLKRKTSPESTDAATL